MSKNTTVKVILFIFSALIFVRCGESKEVDQNISSRELDSLYGEKLIKKGFLDYSDSLKFDSLRNEVVESFNIYETSINRIVSIDAEELVEFNFDFFMPSLNRVLSRRDLKIEVNTTEDYQSSNEIVINGRKIRLYTNSEFENGVFWDSGSRNFFRTINDILKDHKLEERFYLLYGGNDLYAFLLTENQFKIIAERYKNNTKEIPYLP